MGDMKHIRNDLRRRFTELATIEGISVVDDRILRYGLPFEEDTILTSWISEDLKKVMRIQESDYGDEGTFQFSGFVAKAGLDYEYDDLCVIAVSSNEKFREIFELYKLWFIEDSSPEEISGILESYSKRLNESCVSQKS